MCLWENKGQACLRQLPTNMNGQIGVEVGIHGSEADLTAGVGQVKL